MKRFYGTRFYGAIKKENREVNFSVFVKMGEFLLESVFYGDLSHQDLPIYVEKIWLNAHFSKMFKISFFTNRLNFDTISCRLVYVFVQCIFQYTSKPENRSRFLKSPISFPLKKVQAISEKEQTCVVQCLGMDFH